MNTTDATPAADRGSECNALLGQASEAVPLVERLRTDVLWHRRRCNETIARDCQEAADEIERLRGALLDIATAARESPYREQMLWDQALASLIAHHVEFMKA